MTIFHIFFLFFIEIKNNRGGYGAPAIWEVIGQGLRLVDLTGGKGIAL